MKVKVFKLVDGKRGDLIYEFSMKKKQKFDAFDIEKEIVRQQNTNDFLGIGLIAKTGISSISCGDNIYDSYAIDSETNEIINNNNSMLLGNNLSRIPNQGNGNVLVIKDDGSTEEIDLQISFTAYENGIVLSTGQKISLLFSSSDGYLKKFTPTKVVQSARSSAKVFTSYAELNRFVDKNRSNMLTTVKKLGFDYSIEEVNEGATDKNKAELIENVIKKLEELNSSFEEQEQIEDKRENCTIDEAKEESTKRLQKFNVLKHVISQFKNKDTVFMSDLGNGTLFSLSDDAKKALELFKKENENKVPYHIIVSYLENDPIYTILYTSTNIQEWKYERPDRKGYMIAAVYMPWCDSFELGTVQVISANGGLNRIH